MKISPKNILIAIISFFSLYFLLLIFINRNPPAWDEAWYLSESINLYRSFTNGGILHFFKVYIHAFGGEKAPLISVLPLPLYLFLGINYISAMLVNIILLIVVSFITYSFTKLLDKNNNISALFAVVIVNTMPLAHEYIRMFRVEYALSGFSLIWVYYLVKSESFTNKSYVVQLGIWLGLGLLMKSIFPLYIIGAIGFVLFHLLRLANLNKIKEAIKQLFFIGIIGLLIANTWYAFNLKPMLGYALKASFGNVSHWYDVGGSNIFQTLYLFISQIINHGISIFYSLIFVLCLVVSLVRKVNIFKGKGFLLTWILFSIAILFISPNKGIQFTLPLLLPFAILLATMLYDIFRRWGVYILGIPMVFFVICPVMNVPLAQNIFQPPRIHTEDNVPTRQIVNLISREEGRSYLVACVVDQDFFNDFTFNYFATLNYSPYRFIGTYHCGTIVDAVSLVDHADFVITKTGFLGPWFSNSHNDRLRDIAMNNSDFFKEVVRIKAQDNSDIIIYRRIGSLSQFPDPNAS